MHQELGLLWSHRSLIWRMSIKDISDRYAGSLLGIVWSIIGPLFLVSLYTLIFTFIFHVRINQGKPLEYALYALCGLIPWITMQESLTKSTSSVINNASLVKQVIFPVDILPINSIISSLPTTLVGFSIFLIITATLMPTHLSLMILILPLVILCQLIFSFGIGFLLAGIGVYFRDLKEIVNLSLLILMFITPILYLENMLPKTLIIPVQLNPFTHMINMYRDILIYNQFNHPLSFVIFPLLSILIFLIGFKIFQKVKPYFANVL